MEIVCSRSHSWLMFSITGSLALDPKIWAILVTFWDTIWFTFCFSIPIKAKNKQTKRENESPPTDPSLVLVSVHSKPLPLYSPLEHIYHSTRYSVFSNITYGNKPSSVNWTLEFPVWFLFQSNASNRGYMPLGYTTINILWLRSPLGRWF